MSAHQPDADSGQSPPDLTQDRFRGQSIPTSPFAGDDGQATPAVTDALNAWRAGSLDKYGVVATLADTRLFVPVVAVLDTSETSHDGREAEKDSHMATVSVQGPQGERGLLAFTSDSALAAWSATARPVPAVARSVAAAALDEGADVMVIDAQTDHTLIVELPGLLALAQGRDWVAPIADPQIQEEISACIGAVVLSVDLTFELRPGTGGSELQLVLLAAPEADREQVAAVAADVAGQLAASELLRSRLVGGVQLTAEVITTEVRP
ncbi:MAG: SseB family protein [Candidatus Nanopelagicales bacterium]